MVDELTLEAAMRRNTRFFAAQCSCDVVSMCAISVDLDTRDGMEGLLANLAYQGWVAVGDRIWCPTCWRTIVKDAARQLATAKRRAGATAAEIGELHRHWRSLIEAQRGMQSHCRIRVETRERS